MFQYTNYVANVPFENKVLSQLKGSLSEINHMNVLLECSMATTSFINSFLIQRHKNRSKLVAI